MKKAICLITLMFGFVGLAHASGPGSSAKLGDNLSLTLHCISVVGECYRAEFDYYNNPDDTWRHYWRLTEIGVGTNTECCAVVDNFLNLSLPSLEFDGSLYQARLDYYDNPNDPQGYYWVLVAGAPKSVLSNFVGTWRGTIPPLPELDTKTGDLVLTLWWASDGVSLEGMQADAIQNYEDEINESIYTFTLNANMYSNGKLTFALPNSEPENPDCFDWNVTEVLSLSSPYKMKLHMEGTVCSNVDEPPPNPPVDVDVLMTKQ